MGTPNTREVFSMKMTEKIKKEVRSRFKLLEQNYEFMDYVRKEFFSDGRIFKSEPVRFTKTAQAHTAYCTGSPMKKCSSLRK